MKKVAVTVAVLALGLAGCAQNEADNMAANDIYVENEADADINMSLNETEESAGNALENATNAIENAGEAVENATEVVENTTE